MSPISNGISANGTATAASMTRMTVVDLSLSTIDCAKSVESSSQGTNDTPIETTTTTKRAQHSH